MCCPPSSPARPSSPPAELLTKNTHAHEDRYAQTHMHKIGKDNQITHKQTLTQTATYTHIQKKYRNKRLVTATFYWFSYQREAKPEEIWCPWIRHWSCVSCVRDLDSGKQIYLCCNLSCLGVFCCTVTCSWTVSVCSYSYHKFINLHKCHESFICCVIVICTLEFHKLTLQFLTCHVAKTAFRLSLTLKFWIHYLMFKFCFNWHMRINLDATTLVKMWMESDVL